MMPFMKYALLLSIIIQVSYAFSRMKSKIKSLHRNKIAELYDKTPTHVLLFRDFLKSAMEMAKQNPSGVEAAGEGAVTCLNTNSCRSPELIVYISFLRSINLQKRLAFEKMYVLSFEQRPSLDGVSKVVIATSNVPGYESGKKSAAPLYRICVPNSPTMHSFIDYKCPLQPCPNTAKEAERCGRTKR